MPRHKEQKGYFTFVQNGEVDYLNLAYLQALSIKATQKINSYAIGVDQLTANLITDKHRAIFDYIILIPGGDDAANDEWKLANEWKAWQMTPFKETVKLDCDMVFTRNIDHWWSIMQAREVCCTVDVRDYEGKISESRAYRKLFDKNHLPNVYSAFTYFRYGQKSKYFFDVVKMVYKNWPLFRDEILINCRNEKPTTDEVYAIASLFMDEECWIPNGPSFVHMKGAIQGWGVDDDWMRRLYAQVDDQGHLTVGLVRQQYPFHYVNKKFATGELIEKYERILGSRIT